MDKQRKWSKESRQLSGKGVYDRAGSTDWLQKRNMTPFYATNRRKARAKQVWGTSQKGIDTRSRCYKFCIFKVVRFQLRIHRLAPIFIRLQKNSCNYHYFQAFIFEPNVKNLNTGTKKTLLKKRKAFEWL